MTSYFSGYLTETGRRETNQDNVAIYHNKKKTAWLLVLADGMGGYKGGETASKIVIDAANEIFVRVQKSMFNKNNLKLVIQLIFDTAQIKIKEYISKNPELSGMGTTLVCVLVVDNYAVWGNVGDSRAYFQLSDKSNPLLITKDHSLVQDYMDKHDGVVPSSYVNQYSNVITRSLAGTNDKIDIYPIEDDYLKLEDDFTFLLCSDGLIIDKAYDYSYFFFDIINKSNTLDEAANKLFQWAYDAGSTDNITVALLSGRNNKKKKNKVLKSVLIAFSLLILLTFGTFLYNYYLDSSKHNNTQFATTKVDKLPKQKKPVNVIEYSWQGFINLQPIEYSSANKIFSMSWHNYKNSRLNHYVLKIINPKHDNVLITKNTTNEHVTANDFGEELKNLDVGTYVVYLSAVLNNNDTIKSPNSITLNVKK